MQAPCTRGARRIHLPAPHKEEHSSHKLTQAMERTHAAAAAAEAPDEPQRDLACLPDDLLSLCAPPLQGDEAASRAALASCKALGRAVVRTSSLGVSLDVDRDSSSRAARVWRELWGEEQPQPGQCVTLTLISSNHGSPGRCLDELGGVHLTFVSTLVLKVRHVRAEPAQRHFMHRAPLHSNMRACATQGLSLDALLPVGVAALLPTLREARVLSCRLTPAAKTAPLDAACGKLAHVEIEGLKVAAPEPQLAALATAQLRQLAKLPALTSVRLRDESSTASEPCQQCPTLFLLALRTQLTSLRMGILDRQCEQGTQTPTPAWRATLQQVAQCTRLRDLAIPCGTPHELALLAPALQQLRRLRLLPALSARDHGDAMVEVLLRLPHLTSLWWDSCYQVFRRSYTNRPCRWEELVLGSVPVQHLARLPLHSLKSPVRWSDLLVGPEASVADTRAAVVNVTRRCPAGFQPVWQDWPLQQPPSVSISPGADVSGLLKAVQPLLDLPALALLTYSPWSVGVVDVLAEVLPKTCTHLMLSQGSVDRTALERMAASLPWLQSLKMRLVVVSPADVVGFVRTVKRLRQEGREVQLREVVMDEAARVPGVSKARHIRAWKEAVQEVRRMGAGVALEALKLEYVH